MIFNELAQQDLFKNTIYPVHQSSLRNIFTCRLMIHCWGFHSRKYPKPFHPSCWSSLRGYFDVEFVSFDFVGTASFNYHWFGSTRYNIVLAVRVSCIEDLKMILIDWSQDSPCVGPFQVIGIKSSSLFVTTMSWMILANAFNLAIFSSFETCFRAKLFNFIEK